MPITISHSQARTMAEAMWGRGGTTAYRTNRSGAFWFSCSGHGGYIMDDRVLTDAERDLLTRAGFSAERCWGVRDSQGRLVRFRHGHTIYPRSLWYRTSRGESLDQDVLVWVFEEDCEWAAVQVLTGIRSAGFALNDDAELTRLALALLGRWYPQAAEVAESV